MVAFDRGPIPAPAAAQQQQEEEDGAEEGPEEGGRGRRIWRLWWGARARGSGLGRRNPPPPQPQPHTPAAREASYVMGGTGTGGAVLRLSQKARILVNVQVQQTEIWTPTNSQSGGAVPSHAESMSSTSRTLYYFQNNCPYCLHCSALSHVDDTPRSHSTTNLITKGRS
ncbi:hypothetical protein FaHV1S18_125 [Falconid herpesvirus 1]|uniref:Uncharacterized protein n=1 Tax=Falconid herpesvirus 1 TaxID=1510155 RepID=A0A068EPD0_9ALPH|nr:hypothetical protein FaHV1S18_091 [Falconid herpesvirus 1]YP_009046609.1 hypothetical protein FaHV1S18_125 [Falconid herpesvirus 1]AID52781.1 hypothetical protein FaHV1S18_091 [Falconid herpesvirus 1]AID52815.1 hypothetical protein FaHV1S18_125 [Falconid herpesvirus 1]